MTKEELKELNSLDEWLEHGTKSDFPSIFTGNNHIERYRQLAEKFATYPVEMGAMQASFEAWIQKVKVKAPEINAIDDQEKREIALCELFEDDPIIFLNRHDGSHTKKVKEKALELIRCFNEVALTYYEIYFLLCAIIVHDVGNIYGRSGHEKKIAEILDKECSAIIPDTIERRIIARIAGVHGGEIYGNSDTIQALRNNCSVNNFVIKEQLLAAILRFADELADDATRANYDALNSEIISKASQIYHIYSSSLHTVEMKENAINHSYEVHLAFEFGVDIAKQMYGKAGHQRYLIDEIYARTIKMERERRYCIRYLRPYCSLERIRVNITITDPKDVFWSEEITYSLEEIGYPSIPYKTIKDVNKTILTGDELIVKLREEAR